MEHDAAGAPGAIGGERTPARSRVLALFRHPLAKSFLARGATLVPTAAGALLATRLLTAHFDLEVFNSYTLVVSAMALLPLNSLGVGTAVTSAFAGAGPTSDEAQGVTLTAARILTLSMLVLLTGCAAVSLTGRWASIVGPGANSGPGFGLAIAAWALGFVPGLGMSMLLGAHKNHVSLLITGLTAPAAVVGLVAVVVFDAPASLAIMLPALSVVLGNFVVAWLSSRLTGFRWRVLLARIPQVRRHRGRPVRNLVGPALIVSLTVPLTLHGDRLVLSHFSDAADVAAYSVVFQTFGPIGALLAASSQPLWPLYERERRQGIPAPNLWRTMALFMLGSALVGVVLVSLAGPIADLISGGEVDVGFSLPIAMALYVLVGAVAMPLSMKMMEPRGLRVAAICCVIALPLNLGLSIAFAQWIGPSGPLLASVAVSVFVQLIPGVVYVQRSQQRARIPAVAPAQ